MKQLRSILLASSMLFIAATAMSAQGAMVSCTDGTSSAGGRGACSSHGGVAAKKGSMKAGGKMAKADVKRAETRADAMADAKMAKVDAKRDAMKADVKADAKMAKADAKASMEKADARASMAKADAKREMKNDKMAAKGAMMDDRDATGATATCKDGTYSHSKTHTGSCSRHGGVAKFMDSK